jgi:hypothetical protein
MNLAMDHDREVELELFPTRPMNAAGASATARCGDGSRSGAPAGGDACTANGGVVYRVGQEAAFATGGPRYKSRRRSGK